MRRREVLAVLAATPLVLVTRGRGAEAADRPLEAIRSGWREFLPAGLEVPKPGERVELSEEEWRARLPSLAYRVLREADTERAFTSPLNENHERGVYLCAGCDLPLFTSEMKFDSGTGWPSFFTTIPDAFETKRDFVLLIPRTEYHCARCGGHHGHVFGDGPPPTGERWCNNGAALRFVASAG